MGILIVLVDRNGNEIYLTRERWSHINKRHPNVKLEDIQETLLSPYEIGYGKEDDTILYYWKYYKANKRYLQVIVKYLNENGFVITSYYLKNIK